MEFNYKNILPINNHYYLLGLSSTNGICQYTLLVVNFKEEELIIENRYSLNDFDSELKKILKKEYPIILHIEGEEIISKIVVNQVGYKNKLLFNTNPDDFYFYEYFQDGTVYVSIARKSFIDSAVQRINNLNKIVIDVAFGPFVLSNLLPIISNSSALSTNKHTIILDNGKFNQLIDGQKNVLYKINGEEFNQKELPVLASFFGYKYPTDSISFENDFVKQNQEDFLYKKRIKKAIVIFVFFLAFTLVISHFSLGYYLTILGEKQSQYSFSSQKINKLNLLKENLKLKEVIISSNGLFNKNFIAKYTSEIGNSVSNDLKLTRFDFLPVLKKIRLDEKVNLAENEIIVEGQTNDDDVFNNWIIKLQTLPWVKKIDISYDETGKSIKVFKLIIKI